MAIIGTVIAITGASVAEAPSVLAENGQQKTLKLNDTVQPNDTIITPKGIVVEIKLENGRKVLVSAEQTVKFTEELTSVIEPSADDSAVDLATIQSIIVAMKEGKDINEAIEETAAGIRAGGGNSSYGHSFIDLSRILEILDGFGFGLDRSGLQDRIIEAYGLDDLNNSLLNQSLGSSTSEPTIQSIIATGVGVSGARVPEGGSLVFSVTLDKPSNVSTEYPFSIGGTGGGIGTDIAPPTFNNGVTFNPVTGTITVPPGVTTFTVTVPTLPDGINEPDEPVTLTIGGTTGTATIIDPPTIDSIEPGAPGVGGDNVPEGSPIVYTVTLGKPTEFPTEYPFSIGGTGGGIGTDIAPPTFNNGVTFNPVTGTITVPPGVTTFTVTVPTLPDGINEPDEPVTLTIGGTPSTATIIDPPTIDSIEPGAPGVGGDNVPEGSPIVYTVTLGKPTEFPTEYPFSIGGTGGGIGTDIAPPTFNNGVTFNPVTGTITVPPGVTTFTVTVPTLPDGINEPDEPVTLTIGGTTGTATIIDPPTIDSIEPGAPGVGGDNVPEGSPIVYTVTLGKPTEFPTEYPFSIGGTGGGIGTDIAPPTFNNGVTFNPVTGTITVPPGVTTFTVTVPTLPDGINEPDEPVTLTIGGTPSTATIIDPPTIDSIEPGAPGVGGDNVPEGSPIVYTVTLGKPTEFPTEYPFSIGGTGGGIGTDIAPPTFNNGVTFNPVTGTITVPPGVTTFTVTVPTLPDGINEPDEPVTLTIGGTPSTATIIDPPTIDSIEPGAPGVGGDNVPEGSPIVYTVTLGKPTEFPTEYPFSIGGTGGGIGTDIAPPTFNNGVTFNPVTGTITVPPGVTTFTVTVPTLPDGINEPDEPVTLTIGGTPSTATIIDPPTIDSIEPGAPGVGGDNVPEGSPIVYTVTLGKPTEFPTEYPFSIGGTGGGIGTDIAPPTFNNGVTFNPVTGTITVPPGVTTFTVTVPTLPDGINEPDEPVTLTIGGTPSTATIIDPPTIDSIEPGAPGVGGDNVPEGSPIVYTVTLGKPTEFPTEYPFSIGGTGGGIGTDIAPPTFNNGVTFNPVTGTITVPPGVTTFTVTVPTLPDGINEPDEPVTLTIGGTTGTATIIDPPTIDSIEPGAPGVGGDNVPEGSPIVYTVTLGKPTEFPTEYPFSIGGTGGGIGTDIAPPTFNNGVTFNPVTGTITVPPGVTTFTVTVPTLPDGINEPDEPVTLTIGGTTGTATIIDPPTIDSIEPGAPGVGGDNVPEGSPIVYTVTLGKPTEFPTEYPFSIGGTGGGIGTDIAPPTFNNGVTFNPVTGTITVPPGVTTFTVTVPTLPDGINEPDEPVTLTIGGTPSTATIIDANDGPTGTPATITPTEDTPIAVPLAGTDPDGSITNITITTGPTPTQGTLVYDADGNPATPPVAVPLNTALTPDQAATVQFVPAPNYNGPVNPVTFTVTDDGGLTSPPATITIADVIPVNDAPTGTPATITPTEDTPIAVPLAGTDPDGSITNITITTGPTPTQGTLVYDADGNPATPPVAVPLNTALTPDQAATVQFVPAPNYNGPVNPVTFTVTDDGGLTSPPATITIADVIPVNDAPTGTPATITPTEDTPIAVPLAGIDPDGSITNITITTGPTPTQGTLVYDADGNPATPPVAVPLNTALTPDQAATVQFVPAPNYNGPVNPVTFTVTDDGGLTSPPATITIADVIPVNDAPVANDDVASTNINTPINNIDVKANDTDPDNTKPELTVSNVLVSLAQGSVTVNPDGTINFTPALNFTGPATITYTITDPNGLSDTATLIVNVGTNNPPESADFTKTTAEDTPIVLGIADFVFTDPDAAQTLNAVRIDSLPTNGTLTLNGSPVNAGDVIPVAAITAGNLVFTPDLNENGNIYATFTFSVQDNAGAFDPTPNTATFNVTPVNDAPIAASASITPTEDTPISVPLVGTDIDGTIASFTITAGPTPAQGTLVYDADGNPATPPVAVPLNTALTPAQAATVQFVPAANYNGTVAPVTFTVTDNGGLVSPVATVTINNVIPVNDAPTGTPASITPTEDTPISVPLAGTDIDGTIASFTITAGPTPAQGTLVYDADGNPATPPIAVPLNTPLTPAQAATVQFVPAANYNGTVAPVTFTVTDNGGLVSPVATVTINNVIPVNDAPTGTPASITPTEDTPISVPLAGTDIDGTIASFTITAGPTPAQGTLVYDADGNPATPPVAVPLNTALTPAQAATVQFVPTLNYNGTVAPVTYTVTDNGGLVSPVATVTINPVTPVNDAPVDGDESNTVAQNVTLTVPAATGLLANTTDVDGATPTVTSFTVNSTTVPVTPTTPGSTLIPGVGTITINSNGSYSFAPAANYVGPIPSITYTVSDNAAVNPLTDTSTLTLTMGANNPPVDGNETNTVTEDTTLTVADGAAGDLLNNATDVDNNPLSITSFTVNSTTVPVTPTTPGSTLIPGVGTITINSNGSYSFAPVANYAGSIPVITYTVSDGVGGTDTSTLTLSITAVNDAPVATPASITPTEDTPISVPLAGTDIDGTIASFTITAGPTPAQGTLVYDADGNPATPPIAVPLNTPLTPAQAATVQFVPAANYNGTVAPVTFTVTDNGGLVSPVATVTINNVIPVNDAPLATPASITPTEDTPISVPLAGTDIDGTIASFTITAGPTPAQGTLVYDADGNPATPPVAVPLNTALTPAQAATVQFVPTLNYNGTVAPVTYTVTDNGGLVSPVATVTINPVTPVNDAPVDGDESNTVAQNVTLTVPAATGLLANTTDVDGATPTVTSFTVNSTTVPVTPTTPGSTLIPGVGTITINSNGSYSFAPAANYVGPIPSITYTVSDNAAVNPLTDTSTLTLTMGANNPPVDGNETNTVTEDTTLTVADGAAGDLLNNATDVDNNPLSITSFTVNSTTVPVTPTTPGSTLIPGVGTITINSNGSYSFAPVANYTGAIPVITYTVSDGVGGTDTSTLTLSITAVNDAPVATPASITPTEDTPISVPLAGTDIDGTIASFTITAGPTPAQGTLVYDADGNPATPPVAVPLNTALTPAQAATVQFVPTLNYNGTVAPVTFTVTDNGGLVSPVATVTINNVIPVNDAPTGTPASITPTEDTPISVPLAGTDIDGTIASFTITAGPTPAQGTLVYDADGNPATPPVAVPLNTALTPAQAATVQFVPTLNYNGTVAPVTYTVTDNGGLVSPVATVTINPVTPVNDAPVDGDESNTVAQNVTLTVPAATGLLANTTDVDGATPTVTSFTVNSTTVPVTPTTPGSSLIPGVGTITINSNGSYSFAPAANYVGPIPAITYTVSDNAAVNPLTDTSTLTLTMGANNPPVDGNETNTVTEDTTLTVADGAAGDLLNNATDVDNNPLSITSFTVNSTTVPVTPTTPGSTLIPGVGTITINSNGSYSFAPVANYAGSIPVITYTVSDGVGGTDTSTLTLSITAVNDAPVATPASITPTEDTPISVPLAGTDIDGTIASFTITAGPTPAQGTLVYDADGNPATPPVAVPLNTALTPAQAATVQFVPTLNYNGTVAPVTFTVTDNQGLASTPATVTINPVTPVNDPPVLDLDGSAIGTGYLVNYAEGAAGVPIADTDISITDVDDTNIESAVIALQFPETGDTLTVGTLPAGISASSYVITTDPISGLTTGLITLTGSATLAQYQQAIRAITYSNNENAPVTGEREILVTVNDGNANSNTATTSILVSAVNDAPVNTVPGAQTTAEDTPRVFSTANGNAISVTDPDGAGTALTTTITVTNGTFTAITGGGATIVGNNSGTVTISGTAAQINAALNGASFTNALDYNGPASISVSTNDGVAPAVVSTIPVTVTAVADITADTLSTAEDTPISFNPITGTNGATADTFEGTTPQITQINGTNITAGGAAVTVTNGQVTLGAGNVLTFTPNLNFNGTVPAFTYTVSSGGVTETANVNITVTSVNDAPLATPASITPTEDTPISVPLAGTDIDGTIASFTITAGPTPAQGTLVYDADGNPATPPVAVPLNTALTPAQAATVQFVPTLNYNGTVAPVTYTVTDNGGLVSPVATVTINPVTPVNDAPVDGDESNTVAQNVTLTVPAATGLLANTTDVDGATPTVTSFTVNSTTVPVTPTTPGSSLIPGVGTITINSNGSYSFAPAANYVGPIPAITYTVSDNAAVNPLTDTSTLTLTMGANNPPVDGNETNTVTEDTTLTVADGAAGDLLNNATDVDNNPLSITSFTVNSTTVPVTPTTPGSTLIPGVGTITINSNGSYSFAPVANYAGSIPVITYTVSDGVGGTDTSTLTLSITAVNDAPVATPASITPTEDTPISVPLAGTDIDGTIASFTITAGPTPAQGTLVYDADGNPATPPVAVPLNTALTPAQAATVQFVPTLNYNGTVAPVTFTVTDNQGLASTPATVTINPVTPVNDPPVLDLDGSAIGTGYLVNYAEGAAGVPIADTDISITDVDDTNIESAVIALQFPETGDTLTVGTLPAGISASSYVITTDPISGLTTGLITLTGSATLAQYQQAIRAITYSNNENAPVTGEREILVTVNDGNANSNTATTSILVSAVNDAPVNTVPGAQTTAEDTPRVFSTANGNAISVTDPDGAGTALTTTITVTNGTFTAITGGGATIVGNNSGTVTISGTAAQINAALNGASFTNALDYNGPASISVSTNDGVAPAVVSTIPVTVTAVADITADTLSTAEDTPISFNPITGTNGATADTFEGTTPQITQINGTNITAGGAAVTVTNGQVTLGAGNVLTFTPNLNFNGTVPAFTYTVSSGGVTETANVNITVTSVNDAPVALDDVGAVTEDATLTVSIANGVIQSFAAPAGADSDAETATASLTVTAIRTGTEAGSGTAGTVGNALIGTYGTLTLNANGSYIYVADQNAADLLGLGQTANDVFTYTVSDGTGGTDLAQLTITVTGTNDAPVIDLDGSVSGAGYLAPNYIEGSAGIPIADTDITITDVDDTNIESAVIALDFPSLGDTLTVGTLPAGITLQSNINGVITLVGSATLAQYQQAIRAITFSNNENAPVIGERVVNITVNDGNANSNTAVATLFVVAANDAPVNTVPGAQNAVEDTPRVFSTANVNTITVTDPDGAGVALTTTITVTNGTFSAITGGGATIVGNNSGTVTVSGTAAQINAALNGASFTGTPDYNGPASISVSTNDGVAAPVVSTIPVTVTSIIDITNDTVTTAEDMPISFNPVAGTNGATTDTFEGATPQITQINGTNITAGGAAVAVTNGQVTLGAGNVLTFTPSLNFNGTLNPAFTYTVSSGGVTETANVVVNVTPVNDAPTTVADNATAVEGTTTLLASVLANDSDIESNPITVSVFASNTAGVGTQTANGSNTITTALGGTVVMNTNGTYTYTAPARNHNDALSDVDSFAYRATDGSGLSVWTQVNINITDTTPTALNDVDSVGVGSSVIGNVITGAGGVTADLINVDTPIVVTNVVLTSGTQISNNLNATTNVRTIVTNRGTLAFDQDDGSYTYTAGVTPIVVTNPTGVASFTGAGIGLFGFDTAEPYTTATNPSSGLNLAALDATAAGRARFIDNGGETDDGVGVEQSVVNNTILQPNLQSTEYGLQNTEQLVIRLGNAGLTARSVSLALNSLGTGESIVYDLYNAAGGFISTSSSIAGTGSGQTNINITSGTPFAYVVIRSSGTTTVTTPAANFRVDGITIIPEPTGATDVFTYTISDSDTDTSSATLTFNYDSTTTANNETATVFESGINATSTQAGGTLEAQTTETVSGNILANDTGITSFSNITNINGVTPDVNGVITLTDARGSATFYTQNFSGFMKGDYVINLTGDTTQGVNDTLTFNYQIVNSVSNETDNATLTVNIVDDAPIAENTSTFAAIAPVPVYSVFFMIDVSGSMTIAGASGDQRLVDANGNATVVSSTAAGGDPATMTGGALWSDPALGTSTLAQTRDAVKAVITKYFAESSNVSIELGIFSSGARFNNVTYNTLQSALNAVDNLTNVTGGTNYSAGLTALQQMIGVPANPNDGVNRVAYFVTDGVPGAVTGTINNAGAGIVSDTANPSTSTGYTTFVNTNNIRSYALAVGPAVPNTTALVGVHNADADASDVTAGAAGNGRDAPIIVTDVGQLADVLIKTVPESFTGSIAGTGGASSIQFGADGGYVEYIDLLLDSADAGTQPDTTVRFTFNGTNSITNNNNGIAGGTVTGSVLTLGAANGFTKGSLIFDFRTGEYTFTPQGTVAEGEQITIGFGIIDGDGDRAAAVNTITIIDGQPLAQDDYDTLLPSTGAANTKFFEGNVINATGTDGGDITFTDFGNGQDGRDFIVDNADVTSIVFKGFTFNLTAVATNVAAAGTGGTYSVTAGGELTWTSSTDASNVLIFHRDGYYKYTPPATLVATLPQDATQNVSFANNATNANTNGVTLGGYSRTSNINNAPDTAITFNTIGAGVGADVLVNNLENFAIIFNLANHPQGVQNVTINVNAANSGLGNNGSGGIGALQYSIYDIAGDLIGQFSSDQEGVITIPSQFSNIGKILIQPNSSTTAFTGTVAGSALISGVSFNSINILAAPTIPDETIQYTLSDEDGDTSTAILYMQYITNQFSGTAGNETINGTTSNDRIIGLAGDDVINSLAGNDIVIGGAGNDTLDGGVDADIVQGDAGNDSLIGGLGGDSLYGNDGNDILIGADLANSAADLNDDLFGGAGNDTINGGAGGDRIVGGSGDDSMTGGLGSDVFQWELSDKGVKGNPARDIITDFDAAPAASGGDVLNLKDLITGETAGNLANYLHFEKVGTNTILHVSSNGEFATGFAASKGVQVITLQNVDLVQSFTNDQDIIADLVSKQKLITD